MRNADHDSFRPAKQVSKSGQQLIKVYDHICSCLLYHPVDIPDTRHIFVQPENIISYAFDQVDLFILGGRQEVGTFKRIDRRFDLLAKEIWKTAGRTFARHQPPDGLRPSASDGEKVPESDVPGLHPV